MWGEMSYNQFKLSFTEKLESLSEESEDSDIEDYEFELDLDNEEKTKGVFI